MIYNISKECTKKKKETVTNFKLIYHKKIELLVSHNIKNHYLLKLTYPKHPLGNLKKFDIYF